jgi:hypothetical protein
MGSRRREERTTLEEAKLCPKCGKPGEDAKQQKVESNDLPKGTTAHIIYCRTELCPWYNTSWAVQVNPDGSVPAPRNHTGEAKIYAGFEGHDKLAAQVREAVLADEAAQQEPGHEIRGPR